MSTAAARLGRAVCRMALACGLSTIAFTGAVADDGRDFVGVYDVTPVDSVDQTCTVAFEARVQNVSGADRTDLVLRLATTLNPTASYARFTVDALPDRGFARIAGTAAVPCDDFAQWARGFGPLLLVDGPQLRAVELFRGPVPQE